MQNKFNLFKGNVLNYYKDWEKPQVIISDGAYGVLGFKGDTNSPIMLKEWYKEHIKKWSELASAGTTLWFWNTEIGWANIHNELIKNGWEYLNFITWNKGIQHIAGNCNLKTLKSFPVVTEVCVHYYKTPTFNVNEKSLPLKEWLRYEWNRAKLTLKQANIACGVANAASRKYLTRDHLWYAPPPEHFEAMVNYASENGLEEGKPYFSIDGKSPLKRSIYESYFPKFYGKYGITNVIDYPPLHSKERIKINGSSKYFHLNQKPLKLMELLIETSSDEGDVIWEPFGGLFTASLAASKLKRVAFAAEIQEMIFEKGRQRFSSVQTELIQMF